MKIISTILPAGCLAAVLGIAIGQNDKVKDKFAVAPEKVNQIAAAMPEKTPAPFKKKHPVLVFTKTCTFRHGSIPVGVESMKQLGAKTGLFEVTHTEDESVFEPDSLKQFDAVILLNTTGEIFKSAEAGREDRLKKSFVDFIASGKGIIGMHAAGDTYNDWPVYAEIMGTGFQEHPWTSGETVRVKNLDPKHPLNAAFKGEGLTIKDEIYKFKPGRAQPDSRRMLLALDPSGTDLLKDDKDKDGKPDREFYPIAWLDTHEKGRVFYCSLGHNDEVYMNPIVVGHYLAGIQYALGELEADAAPMKVAMLDNEGRVVVKN